MKNSKDSFKGLLLEFFKRQVSQNRPDLGLYDIVLFGHYDGLTIRQIESWYEFSPHLINMYNTKYSEASVTAENYPVKLLYPSSKVISQFCKSPFYNYECWSTPSTVLTENNPCPLFAILLVNFSGEYVHVAQQNNDFNINILISKLNDTLNKLSDCSSSDLQIAVFQALGYYDCALLFRTNKWDHTFEIINRLQKIKYAGIQIISNTYFMPGLISLRNGEPDLSADDICNSYTISSPTKCRVSISFRLKEKVTSEQFFGQLHSKAKALNRHNGFSLLKNADLYHSSGNIDCMLLFKGDSLSPLLREYLSGGLLTPDGNGLFEDNISSIRTSVSYEMAYDEDFNDKGHNNYQSNTLSSDFQNILINNKRAIEGMRQAINTYAAFAQKNGLSMRQIAALTQIINYYENLTHSSHTFDIQTLMIPVWNMLSDNITTALDVCNNQDYKAAEIDMASVIMEAEKERISILEKTVQSMTTEIESFRVLVGSFLQTLSYSDSFFIERMRSNYPAIGSATKLLFAYNRILMQMIKVFGNYNNKGNIYKYVCLITCGGCDETSAYNLSEYVPLFLRDEQVEGDRHIEEKRIIVIQLSERSIYDSSGALLRCVHELWHYCGDRHREKRYHLLIDVLCALRSQQMIDELLPIENLFNQLFLKENEYVMMTTEDQYKWKRITESIRNEKMVELKNSWSEQIKKYINIFFEELITQWGLEERIPFVLYGNNLYNLIGDVEYMLYRNTGIYLEDYIISRSETEEGGKIEGYIKDFISKISIAYDLCKADFFDCMEDRLIEEGLVNLYYKADTLRQLHKTSYTDHSFSKDIHFLLDLCQYMNKVVDQNSSTPQEADTTKSVGINAWFFRSNYEISKRIFHDVFQEIYSDYMTCKTLNPSFSEYIYSFLYENNDIAVAMPDNELHCMRIGTVIHKYFLHCCSDVDEIDILLKQLDFIPYTDYRPNSIKSNYLQEYSYISVSDLKDRLRILWESYWQYYQYGIITPFIDYLTACDDNFKKEESMLEQSRILQEIRSFYKDTRLIVSEENVLNYFDAIINQWALLAKDENR